MRSDAVTARGAKPSTTVDLPGAETSSVNPLPTLSPNKFTVSWSGSDVGSGIGSYTIFVSSNGGAFSQWLVGTALTSATYAGQSNHTYSFYSVATDKVGNVQIPPFFTQASTQTLLQTPNQEYVAALYLSLLHRTVDPSGLAAPRQCVDQGRAAFHGGQLP